MGDPIGGAGALAQGLDRGYQRPEKKLWCGIELPSKESAHDCKERRLICARGRVKEFLWGGSAP